MIPLARTADLHLDIRPGTDSALFGAILNYMVQHDMLDHDFIDNHTSGFEAAKEAVKEYSLEWAEEITGTKKEKIEEAAKLWGKAATSFLLHARGIEHHTKGVENVLSCINIVLASGRIGRGMGRIVGNRGNGCFFVLFLQGTVEPSGLF
jgi:assimilatory nitrate reductase catalytic subunit